MASEFTGIFASVVIGYMIFHDTASHDHDRFFKVRNLMTDTFNAGYILCADELCDMVWGNGILKECHKIARKPRGMTCAADCITGIMVFLEICEFKEGVSCKKFTGPNVNKSTVTTLRLTEQWFGSWRIIIGDLCFVSITTAIALYEHCLYFIGLVKTGYREFPICGYT